MSVLSVVLGVAVVVLVAADLGLTVLHPSLRGPLSNHVEHLAWAAVRGLTHLGGRDRLLSFGGPAAMAADRLTWVLGLWLGFAPIYARLWTRSRTRRRGRWRTRVSSRRST